MIDVVFDPARWKLTVEGHAQSAEAGKDLVCAAATILIYTLSDSLEEAERRGYTLGVRENISSGSAMVQAAPRSGEYDSMKTLTTIFETICRGFTLLAEQFPEYVDYTEL